MDTAKLEEKEEEDANQPTKTTGFGNGLIQIGRKLKFWLWMVDYSVVCPFKY